MKRSNLSKTLAVLLSVLTILSVIPVLTLSASAFDYPDTVKRLNPDIISITESSTPGWVFVEVDKDSLDTVNYDWYYTVKQYTEWGIDSACLQMNRFIGADVEAVKLTDTRKVGSYGLSMQLHAEDGDNLMVCVYGVAKGADVSKSVNVYQVTWDYKEVKAAPADPDTIVRLTDAIWIGDSTVPGVAAIEFNTKLLDFDTYDYYYTAKQYTEFGVSSACMEMNGFIGAEPQLVALTGEKKVPASGSVTFALDAEEGNNLMVCLYGFKKDYDIETSDVYVVAWDYDEVTLPVPAPEKTEAELVMDFAFKTGFMTPNDNGKEKLALGDLLTRLGNVAGKPVQTSGKKLTKFVGVSEDNPSYGMLLWAEEHKLFVPSSKPIDVNAGITRVQFVYILNKLAGNPTASGDVHFADTFKSAYYIKQLDWAVDAGIIAENVDCNAKFNPHAVITLEDAALWVYRLAESGLINA